MDQNPANGNPVERNMSEDVIEESAEKHLSASSETEGNQEAEVKTADSDTAPLPEQEDQLHQMTSELLSLREQNSNLKNDLKQAHEQALRAQAEVQNINRRSQQDVEKAHKFALEKFIDSLLPVVDSLERGIESAGSTETGNSAVKEGMELTLKLFLDTLEKFNVFQINPEGETFNPDQHQAVSQQESAECDPGSVISVFQKGYSLNNRLIRPAMVVVAKASSD